MIKINVLLFFLSAFLAIPVLAMEPPVVPQSESIWDGLEPIVPGCPDEEASLESGIPISPQTPLETLNVQSSESLLPEQKKRVATKDTQEIPKRIKPDNVPLSAEQAMNQSLYYKCVVANCPVILTNGHSFKSHILEEHTSLRPYECPVAECKYVDSKSVRLGVHLKRHHPGIKMPVLSEEKKQIIEKTLAPFMGKLMTQCPKCSKKFGHPSRLAIHMRIQHPLPTDVKYTL